MQAPPLTAEMNMKKLSDLPPQQGQTQQAPRPYLPNEEFNALTTRLLRTIFSCYFAVTVVVSGIEFSLTDANQPGDGLLLPLAITLLKTMALYSIFLFVANWFARRPLHQLSEFVAENARLYARLQAEQSTLRPSQAEQEQTLLARESATAQAEQERTATQNKTTFFSSMGHELRTPLNAVLGYAQLLQHDTSLNPRQRADVSAILRSGEHLLSLVNDLVDISKIEAGKLELVLSPVNLPNLLTTVADIIRGEAKEKDLTFVLDIQPYPDKLIMLDEKRLRQVLLKLLSNAVKFTDQGQISLKVQCLAAQQEPIMQPIMQPISDPQNAPITLRFEVTDTGRGIDAAQYELIFAAFEQLGSGQRRAANTGLGLAISRRLVRLMGGDITVNSQSGKGSCFGFGFMASMQGANTLQSPRQSGVAAPLVLATAVAEQPRAALKLPPLRELNTLHELALDGNLRRLRKQANALLQQDPTLQTFFDKLLQPTDDFQIKTIQHYLSTSMDLSADQTNDRRRSFLLRDVIHNVLAHFQPQLEHCAHRICVDIAADLSMESYPGVLDLILGHFLSNTLLHGFDGMQQRGIIEISATVQRGQSVQLRFSDNGHGIANERLGKIFDPFYTTKMGRGGSGIGLYVCYNLTTAILGARIAVNSEPGVGTEFVLDLPMVAPEKFNLLRTHGN